MRRKRITDVFVVIPTRTVDARTDTLAETFSADGLKPVTVVESGPPAVVGETVYRTGSTFDSWVNEGARLALTATRNPAVIVCTSDMVLLSGALDPMVAALEDHDVVGLAGDWQILTVPSPLRGHLFGFRPKAILMPEPAGVALWWWNTDLLYHEACDRGLSVGFVDVAGSHDSDNVRPDGSWRYPTEFQWSVQADHDYFWERHHSLNPEHMDCYLTWWPAALPTGQVHKTEWP